MDPSGAILNNNHKAASMVTEIDGNANDLHDIAHQLTRIADIMSESGKLQITQAEADNAWPLPFYREEYHDALDKLGIEII